MFNIQKYADMMTIGYLVQDAIFCTIYGKMDAALMQTYIHHLLGIGGCVTATYVGGFFGSISQLTIITELSTPFVNLRWILAKHKLEKSSLYIAVALMMTLSFFVLRVCFCYYMIFNQLVIYCLYRKNALWAMYPKYKWKWCYVAIALYIMLYFLNLFWFSKMLYGMLKALGLTFDDKVAEEEEDKSG